ncbi:MAG: L-glutamate gamma-semialdehyde dehydrogenase [Pseudomonadota bacterium]
MLTGRLRVPAPQNEPVLDYAKGSPERQALDASIAELSNAATEVPGVIGGDRVHTGKTTTMVMPHAHAQELGTVHRCGASEVAAAADAAAAAWPAWSAMAWQDRVAIFLKAADLLAGPWRSRLNAATMLGQSKTAHQAEIDSACELIDFLRFNAHFAEQIMAEQPASSPGVWNMLDHRPLEGFVFAVTPFNFTAIAGNLPTAPAMMGNTVIWKPSSTQCLSAWLTMQLLEEAGLPPRVINFVPGSGGDIGDPASAHPDLAGLHFTGSTRTFRALWTRIGDHIDGYRGYPRIVGETGGKDFVVMHPTADVDAVVTGLVRGAFEYQGQKCSAASRAFIPESKADVVLDKLIKLVQTIRVGDVREYANFMGAVIDANAFRKISTYIEHARTSDDHEVLVGGRASDTEGWFVEPTVVRAASPTARLMVEEIFGPILSVHVYPDNALEETLDAVDAASPYALTGAVFARDRAAIAHMTERLRFAAGNFYINDKPTGAVVGQQPFGGARASGTNDKAGSALNLLRWTSPRTVKETFDPPTDYRYPYMS